MQAVAKGANMALMFFLEVGVYVAIGYWGFTLSSNWWVKLLCGIAVPVLYAVVWGIFASPKASFPVHGLVRAALEIVWFGSGVAAAAAAGLITTSAIFAVLFVANAILRIVWHQV